MSGDGTDNGARVQPVPPLLTASHSPLITLIFKICKVTGMVIAFSSIFFFALSSSLHLSSNYFICTLLPPLVLFPPLSLIIVSYPFLLHSLTSSFTVYSQSFAHKQTYIKFRSSSTSHVNNSMLYLSPEVCNPPHEIISSSFCISCNFHRSNFI